MIFGLVRDSIKKKPKVEKDRRHHMLTSDLHMHVCMCTYIHEHTHAYKVHIYTDMFGKERLLDPYRNSAFLETIGCYKMRPAPSPLFSLCSLTSLLCIMRWSFSNAHTIFLNFQSPKQWAKQTYFLYKFPSVWYSITAIKSRLRLE